ncbi:hypothetical protein HPB52_022765 [Rhipicephalus sanguineus]|uniref:Uncharacterized protein n=1 Tax=Rhipicephalus sanguineus TaxID=34632 RepID=A0A9D4SR06_RHISA|nr:hypothetical protein HPB52_022765 [Rhipicephalus sanguineus]
MATSSWNHRRLHSSSSHVLSVRARQILRRVDQAAVPESGVSCTRSLARILGQRVDATAGRYQALLETLRNIAYAQLTIRPAQARCAEEAARRADTIGCASCCTHGVLHSQQNDQGAGEPVAKRLREDDETGNSARSSGEDMDQASFMVVNYKNRGAGIPVVRRPMSPEASFRKVNPNILASAVVASAQEKVIRHRLNKDGSLMVTVSTLPAANRLLTISELAAIKALLRAAPSSKSLPEVEAVLALEHLVTATYAPQRYDSSTQQ